MAMPAVAPDPSRHYTVKEVLAFPDDGNRYELVDGVLLVSPSPRRVHQAIVVRVLRLLGNHLEQFGLAETVYTSPADITWGSETLVQPDIFVVPLKESGGEWRDVRHLRLAIEVISPSTERHDRFVKRVAYQRHGVETYWIVDPYAKTVEVWTPEAEAPIVYTDRVSWRHAPDAEPFVVDLPQLWARARRGQG